MNNDIKFLIKIVRNGTILSLIMFTSIFATETFSYEMIKPVIVFFMGYIGTELARRYKLTPQNKKGTTTLIY